MSFHAVLTVLHLDLSYIYLAFFQYNLGNSQHGEPKQFLFSHILIHSMCIRQVPPSKAEFTIWRQAFRFFALYQCIILWRWCASFNTVRLNVMQDRVWFYLASAALHLTNQFQNFITMQQTLNSITASFFYNGWKCEL